MMIIDLLGKKYSSCKEKIEALKKFSNNAINDIQEENTDLIDYLDINKNKINITKEEIEKRDQII